MRVTLPKSWGEIPISSFPALNDIVIDEDVDSLEKCCMVISTLSGINFTDVQRLPFAELNKLIEQTAFVFKYAFPEKVEQFNYKGYTWKMNFDHSRITAADFISFSKYSESINNITEMVALFATPYKKKWFKLSKVDIEFKEKVLLLSEAPCSIMYPLSVFFCKVIKSSSENIQTYLERKAVRTMWKMLRSPNTIST